MSIYSVTLVGDAVRETYGEDPYLTGQMGMAVVRGLQGPEDARYDKLHACAKHFAVHSGPEWNRHSFDAENIDPGIYGKPICLLLKIWYRKRM